MKKLTGTSPCQAYLISRRCPALNRFGQMMKEAAPLQLRRALDLLKRRRFKSFFQSVRALKNRKSKIKVLEIAFSLYSDDLILANALAAQLIRAERVDEAYRLLNLTPKEDWDAGIFNTYATALNKLGKPREALDLLYKDLKRERWDTRIFNTTAKLHIDLQEFKQAAEVLEELIPEEWTPMTHNLWGKAKGFISK
jgi:tetratricopeptide (TPR) repeat protein